MGESSVESALVGKLVPELHAEGVQGQKTRGTQPVVTLHGPILGAFLTTTLTAWR